MLLSDAIATGRTLVVRCVAGGSTRQKAQPGDGCVLDMAALAVGKRLWTDAKEIWPWLSLQYEPESTTYESAIYGRFDVDVQKGLLTLDQLIDWVRSVEPAEPEPQSEPTIAEGYARCTRALEKLVTAAEGNGQ